MSHHCTVVRFVQIISVISKTICPLCAGARTTHFEYVRMCALRNSSTVAHLWMRVDIGQTIFVDTTEDCANRTSNALGIEILMRSALTDATTRCQFYCSVCSIAGNARRCRRCKRCLWCVYAAPNAPNAHAERDRRRDRASASVCVTQWLNSMVLDWKSNGDRHKRHTGIIIWYIRLVSAMPWAYVYNALDVAWPIRRMTEMISQFSFNTNWMAYGYAIGINDYIYWCEMLAASLDRFVFVLIYCVNSIYSWATNLNAPKIVKKCRLLFNE